MNQARLLEIAARMRVGSQHTRPNRGGGYFGGEDSLDPNERCAIAAATWPVKWLGASIQLATELGRLSIAFDRLPFPPSAIDALRDEYRLLPEERMLPLSSIITLLNDDGYLTREQIADLVEYVAKEQFGDG